MNLVLAYPDVAADLRTSTSRNIEDFLNTKESNKYTSLNIFSGNTLVSHEKLSELFEYLESNSPVIIKYSQGSSIRSSDALESVKLSGLLSIEVIEGDDTLEIRGVHTQKAVARVRKSKDALKAILTAAPPSNTQLIDDSALLKEEDLVKSEVSLASEECGPKAKKKACKNCSCGLKELEEAEEKSKKEEPSKVVDTTNAKSSCGSVRIRIYLKAIYINYLFLFLVLFG